MIMEKRVNLSGREYVVAPMPLGRLKIMLPAFNRASRVFETGSFTEAAMSDVAVVLATAFNITQEEAEALPVMMDELLVVLGAIAEVSGLIPRAAAAGELQPAASLTGTNSTAG